MSAQNICSGFARWLLVGALLAALVPSASAINAPPRRLTAPEILELAIVKIDATTTSTTDRIDVLADRAVFRLERLARKGASQTSLEKDARKSKKGFSNQARSGYAQVTRDVGNAMIRMRSADGYSPDLQDDLFFERETSTAALEDSVDAAAARVDAALAELQSPTP